MCFSLCAVDAMHLPHPSALTPNSKQKGIRMERERNSFPPPAHPFPLSWIPTILRRAHPFECHFLRQKWPILRPSLSHLSLPLFLPISPPSSPSFVRSVTQNYNDDDAAAAAAADPT